LVAVVLNVVLRANVLSTYTFHGGEHCHRVLADGAVGLEYGGTLGKIVLFTSDGSRRSWLLNTGGKSAALSDPSNDGHLFAYTNGALVRVKRVREPEGFRFHPHGMSLVRARSNDRVRIFVVNHQPHHDEVVIYNYDDEKHVAEYIDVVRDKTLFRSVNDVDAISETELYATIWEYYDDSSLWGTIEKFLGLKWTYVVRCVKKPDIGWECRVAADQLATANGVSHTAKKDYVLVAESSGRAVDIYARNIAGVLTLKHSFDALGLPDNFYVSDDGRIFLVNHPQPLKFLKHSRDASAKSPTQVLELIGGLNGPTRQLKFLEWYIDDEFSGGTVAVLVDNTTLLIGSVFENGLMACDMTKLKPTAT